MLYLNERYLKLDWDEANRILLAEWRGFSNSTDFRAGLATGLEIVAKHRVANWLADIREAKVISIDDQNYHGQVWIPQAIKLGLKRMAFVVPRMCWLKWPLIGLSVNCKGWKPAISRM